MNARYRLGLAPIGALVACLAMTTGLQAASGPEAGESAAATNAPQVKLAPLKLLKTFIDSGTLAGAGLPAFTYQVVGNALEYTCAVDAGCPVAATLELQIKQVGANAPALCLYVDDVSVSCPTNDQLSATSGFKVMSHHASTLLPVSATPHKLEMRVYSQVATQLYRYQAEYRVFR